MSMDFVEELFDSVSTIVSQKISDINYDATIVATIVDDSDRLNGHYIVTDGTIKFDAYSDISTYLNEDQVRIAILNNDWTKKKFITGKYTGQIDTTAVAYLAPLDTTFTTSYLTFPIEKKTIELKANESGALNRIFEIDLSAKGNEVYSNLINNIYDVLTISAKIRTSGLENATNGNYGLKVDIATYGQKGKGEIIHSYDIFDSSEMIGNPYNFIVDSYQSKSIDLSALGTIKEIILTAYESSIFAINDKGELYVEDNPFEFSGGFDSPTIIFSDITLGYGKNLKNIEDNTLQLYTGNSEFYTYNNGKNDPLIHNKILSLNWYNKDENGKFIGFSDGIADSNYDEIEYLANEYEITRLTAQMGSVSVASDEDSLRLSANINESIPLMEQACEMLTTNVSQQLQNLWPKINDEQVLADNLKGLIHWSGETPPSLVEYSNKAKEYMNAIKKHYTDILQYGYYIQNFQPVEESDFPVWTFNTDLVTEFKAQFNKVKEEKIDKFFTDYNDLINNNAIYNIYENIIEDCKTKVDKEWGKVNSLLNQLTISDNDLITLQGYETKELYIEYEPEDIAKENEPRYCTYLYQYDDGYELTYEDNQREYKFGRFLTDPHWKRLDVKNFGLPTGENDKFYPIVSGENSEHLVTLRENSEIEKFKAILFYNHLMYESNELIFRNEENVPSDVAVNNNDLLLISHGNNSKDHYQSYSSAFDLLNISDASKRREISCSYVGIEMGNEALIGAKIFWYIPKNSTLITYDTTYLKSLGFSTDEETSTNRSKENYTLFSKTIEASTENKVNEDDLKFYYQIKPYFEQNTQNNTILVEAELRGHEDIPAHGELPLTFSTFGNNGTKYTLEVSPANINQIAVLSSEDNELLSDEDCKLHLKAVLYDANGNEVESNISFSWYDDCETPIGRTNNIAIIPSTKKADFVKWDRILKATTKIANDEIQLSSLYSVPYSTDKDYYISGPPMIVYNNLGTVARVSEEPYCLYQHTPDGDVEVKDQVWEIRCEHRPQDGIEYSTASLPVGYLPSLNKDNTIRPAPMYYIDIEKEYSVFAICKVNGKIKWIQPIIIIQNKYESSLLNDWDGSLIIDEQNNLIMTAMVGAGRKEPDNSFSGVLMGDIKKADFNDIGLFGFDCGAQSFRFGVDGKASLGVSGKGRIEFDGNHGLIKSSVWDGHISGEGELTPGSVGMAISLEDGHIDAHDFKLTSENVNFNSGYSVTVNNPYYMNIESSPIESDLEEILSETILNKNLTYYYKQDDDNWKKLYLNSDSEIEYLYKDSIIYKNEEEFLKVQKLAIPQNHFIQIIYNSISTFDDSYYKEDIFEKYLGSSYEIRNLENEVIYPPIPKLYIQNENKTYKVINKKDDFKPNTEYWIYNDGKYESKKFEEFPTDIILYQQISEYDYTECISDDFKSENKYYIWTDYKLNGKTYEGYQEYVDDIYPLCKKDSYPQQLILYKPILRDRGYYYIRFDKNGKLDLSISDATVLAESGITLGQYFDNISKEITHIEDEVIGMPPELKGKPIYDHLAYQIRDIKDSVIGNPADPEAGSVYSYINAQKYLSSEGVFNGLTNNGKKLGIFPMYDDGKVDDYGNPIIKDLYINASYVSTGILRSNNWEGTLKYSKDGGETWSNELNKDQAYDLVSEGQASWDDTWSLNPIKGTYWNLNDGKLWASKFELSAWKNNPDQPETEDNDGGLYLNSHPDPDGYYLSLGKPNDKHFIQYTGNGDLIIQVKKNFVLDAFNGWKGIYFNSNPEVQEGTSKDGYYFVIGDDESFIQLDKQGNFTIQTNDKFVLNAWNNNHGIYIDSEGEEQEGSSEVIYFRAGTGSESSITNDTANFIEVQSNKLVLSTQHLIADGWSHNERKGSNGKNIPGSEIGGIYFNSQPQKYEDGEDSYFKIGNDKHFIQYTKNHEFLLNLDSFVLDAFTNQSGIYLNSDPTKTIDGLFEEKDNEGNPIKKAYWFILGNANNFIQMDAGGSLTFQTNDKFIVNAWSNNDGGLYLNSKPNPEASDGSQYYFAIGKLAGSHITFDANDNLDIKVNSLTIGSSSVGDIANETSKQYFDTQFNEKNILDKLQLQSLVEKLNNKNDVFHLENGCIYIKATYINAGLLNAGNIQLENAFNVVTNQLGDNIANKRFTPFQKDLLDKIYKIPSIDSYLSNKLDEEGRYGVTTVEKDQKAFAEELKKINFEVGKIGYGQGSTGSDATDGIIISGPSIYGKVNDTKYYRDAFHIFITDSGLRLSAPVDTSKIDEAKQKGIDFYLSEDSVNVAGGPLHIYSKKTASDQIYLTIKEDKNQSHGDAAFVIQKYKDKFQVTIRGDLYVTGNVIPNYTG